MITFEICLRKKARIEIILKRSSWSESYEKVLRTVSYTHLNTDYILAGENMGPAKLEKANQLGIKIITEEEFLKMIE